MMPQRARPGDDWPSDGIDARGIMAPSLRLRQHLSGAAGSAFPTRVRHRDDRCPARSFLGFL